MTYSKMACVLKQIPDHQYTGFTRVFWKIVAFWRRITIMWNQFADHCSGLSNENAVPYYSRDTLHADFSLIERPSLETNITVTSLAHVSFCLNFSVSLIGYYSHPPLPPHVLCHTSPPSLLDTRSMIRIGIFILLVRVIILLVRSIILVVLHTVSVTVTALFKSLTDLAVSA